MADLEAEVPVRGDSVFRIGSITKQFTAVAILQLYEQGRLDLADEVQKYLPQFPRSARKITLEKLLTHTSGVKNLTELQNLEIRQSPYTPGDLIDLFEDLPPDFQPGEQFRSSNSGYILLGRVIEIVSGRSYADYVQTEIFAKLGMTTALYDDPASIIKHRARGYDLDSSYKLVNSAYLNMSFPYAAGGLAMGARDYLKWHQGLLANRLLKKETLQRAWTPFRLNDQTATQYGYGWGLRDLFGSKTIEHGGRIHGFNAKATWLPQEEILVVTFSNGTFVNTDIINDQAAAIAAEKRQYREVRLSATVGKRYIGKYKFPGNDPTTIEIFSKNGSLFLKDGNSPAAWKMIFTADDTFVCYEVFPNIHVFAKNADGAVEALIIRNPGGDVRVARVR